jgi:hypothetical protein
MKKLLFVALAAGAVLSTVGVATAQVYLDFGRPVYRERYYDYYDQPRYYRGYEYDRPARYRRNPCRRGFTVQDGVCKPYRGY